MNSSHQTNAHEDNYHPYNEDDRAGLKIGEVNQKIDAERDSWKLIDQ